MKKISKYFSKILFITGMAMLATVPVMEVSAGWLDSVAIDPGATTLHAEETVMVPANGAVGSNIYVSGRAFLSIDFAVQPGKQVTLLVITDRSAKSRTWMLEDRLRTSAGSCTYRWNCKSVNNYKSGR